MRKMIATMAVPVLLVLAVVCLELSHGYTMDNAFCKSKQAGVVGTCIDLPELPKDYKVHIESTKDTSTSVQNAIEIMSTTQQKVFVETDYPGQKTKFVAMASNDLLAQVTSHGSCLADPLGGSDFSKGFKIKYDSKNKLVIPEQKSLILSTSVQHPSKIADTNIRGIPASAWQLCAFRSWDNTTRAAVVYYSKGYTMPGATGSVPLLTSMNVKDSYNLKTMMETNHIFNFQDTVAADEPRFQLETDMWCQNRPEAKNLPKMPLMYEFKAEQYDLHDINDVNPTKLPEITYFKETLQNLLDRFIIDTEVPETSKTSPLHEFRGRSVHDFRTGIAFNMDLTSGQCVNTNITKGSGTVVMHNGKVEIATPNQLLDLTGHSYQYMGEHVDWDREIPADVYTSFQYKGKMSDDNYQSNTWYFVSRNYMMNKMKAKKYHPIPLRLKTTVTKPTETEDTKIFDVYDYTRSVSDHDTYPDLSSCFTPSQEIYVDMLVDGQYDLVYLANKRRFLNSFRMALLDNTDLDTFVRIANLRVYPAYDYKILVRFTLLGLVKGKGDSKSPIIQMPNDILFEEIQGAVKNGRLVIKVQNPMGTYNVKVTNVIKHSLDPDSFAGHFAAAKSNDGFTPGAMGGLGIGTLVLGILLGFVGIKVAPKLRKSNPNDISMQALS